MNNEQMISAECPNCSGRILVRESAVSIFCMQCKTWTVLKLEDKVKMPAAIR